MKEEMSESLANKRSVDRGGGGGGRELISPCVCGSVWCNLAADQPGALVVSLHITDQVYPLSVTSKTQTRKILQNTHNSP